MALHLTPEVGSLTLGITVPGANCSTLAQTAGNGRNLNHDQHRIQLDPHLLPLLSLWHRAVSWLSESRR